MLFKLSTAFVFLAALAQVKAAPTLISRHEGHDDSAATSAGTSASDLVKKNALEAQGHNARFATLKETDPCNNSEMACIDGGFAMCVSGKWSVQKCSTGTRCYALPLLLKAGTSLVCDTEDDANLRFTDAGVTGGTKGTDLGGDDDGDDIPDCEEEDEDVEARGVLDRRQASTIVADFPSTSTSTLSSASSSSSSTSTRGSTSTSAAPVITPTVVIGSDGIVTVTIVSTATVTLSATDCAATETSSTIPVATVTSSSATPLTVVSATPTRVSSSTRATLSTSSSVSSTTAAAPTTSSSAIVILLTTSSPTGTSSASAATGLSFSVTPTQSA